MILKLPKPFLGGILVEVKEEDVDDYMTDKAFSKAGLDKNSTLASKGFSVVYAEATTNEEQIVTGRKVRLKRGTVPIKKGKIIKLSPDAFGEVFINKYGDVGETPGIGDIVYYIPGQSYKVDLDEKYHLIKDEDIMAWGEVEIEVSDEINNKVEVTHE